MKLYSILFAAMLFSGTLFSADYRDISKVRTVYILGMSSGLDQYLANRLTSDGVVWIVLDPARADAILTDRLDDAFWSWLNGRYPLVSKAPVPAQADDLRAKDLMGSNVKNKGNVFLVDPKSRLVLWSCYDQAKRESPDDLDRVALRVTKRLKTSMAEKK
jgi:hypothetical protein